MIGLTLLVLAVVALLLWISLRRHQTGLTEGDIVYEAAGTARIDDALVSRRYKLVGRPDYVARMPQGLVPVEVKSRSCGKVRMMARRPSCSPIVCWLKRPWARLCDRGFFDMRIAN